VIQRGTRSERSPDLRPWSHRSPDEPHTDSRHARSFVSSVRQVQEQWRFLDEPGSIEAISVVETIERRVSEGTMTTWVESSRGRMIVFVSNGSRALVLLLEHDDGDPGEHAVDPDGDGLSGGFVLENGQVDEYPDRDTVPMGEALRILAHLVSEGVPPSDASWQVDR
jgi:hypothetical protein